MSLGAALGALGFKLLVVADDATLPAITRQNLYSSKHKDAAKGPPVALPVVEATTPPRSRS
jgi:hypothetical protein